MGPHAFGHTGFTGGQPKVRCPTLKPKALEVLVVSYAKLSVRRLAGLQRGYQNHGEGAGVEELSCRPLLSHGGCGIHLQARPCGWIRTTTSLSASSPTQYTLRR